jgi:hypothetical protein
MWHMITPENLTRVTVTLHPQDVDLLDRLGKLEGANRSAELRGILEQFRPMLRQTVEAMEAVARQRVAFDETIAAASVEQLQALMPEVEKLQNAYLGAFARIEGAAAAAAVGEDADPRPSNHGGHTPTPPPGSATPEMGSEQDNSGDES